MTTTHPPDPIDFENIVDEYVPFEDPVRAPSSSRSEEDDPTEENDYPDDRDFRDDREYERDWITDDCYVDRFCFV